MLVKFWELATASLDLNFVNNNYASSSLVNTPFKNKSFNDVITFSRGTNATLTDSTGTLAYAPHNLLTFSEQFDNAAWTKTRSSITANTIAAPDGTLTADKLVEDTSAGTHLVSVSSVMVAATRYTYSVSIKAAERQWVAISPGSTWGYAWFNAATGAIGTSVDGGSNIQINVTPQGDGWFRCAITATAVANSGLQFLVTTGDGVVTYTGDGVSGIYLWGAQLNVGALQPYYSTTVDNLLGYTQEFDNAAWTKSNSFVQTNLLTFSEQFDNAAWLKSNSSITANTETAPDGTITADTLTATTNAAQVQASITGSVGIVYTASIWIKRKTGTGQVSLRSVENVNTLITVTDAWQRFDLAVTSTTTTIRCGVLLQLSGDEVYVWGAQLVQGATAGDYQVTTNTAKAVMYPAPDGSVTADKLVESAATSSHSANIVTTSLIVGAPYTYSIYARAAEAGRFLAVAIGGTAYSLAQTVGFTLSGNGGAVVLGGELSTASITSVGNNWYRCSVTTSAQANGTALIVYYISTSGTSGGGLTYTGDGTSGIYVWGAQLSDSASLDPYVYNPAAAPASTAYYGPRFDYDPVTLACKGLLIEEQRTNLTLNSDIATASTGTAVTADSSLAPDNTMSMDLVYETETLGEHYAGDRNYPATVGAVYCFSVFVKDGPSANRNYYHRIALAATTSFIFNPRTKEISSVITTGGYLGHGSINYSNGVSRVWIAYTAQTTTNAVNRSQLLNPTLGGIYTGDGTSGVYIWGAQLEAGVFPTSYIPTTTTALTRAADVATMTGANFSNWYNQTEGAVYFEGGIPSDYSTGFPMLFSINDATTNNNIQPAINAAANVLNVEMKVAGSVVAGFYPAYTSGTTKLVFTYKLNDVNYAKDGVAGTTDTSAAIPAVTQMNLGATQAPSNFLNGHIARISYYPTRLADTDLVRITK